MTASAKEKTKPARVSMQVPYSFYDQLKKESERTDLPMSTLIRLYGKHFFAAIIKD